MGVNIMKPEFYTSVLAKAKVAFAAKTDMEFAKIIGVDQSAISHAKKSNTLPIKHIVNACIDKGVSVDWIFGINPQKISNGVQQ